jgi:hypothetical protein
LERGSVTRSPTGSKSASGDFCEQLGDDRLERSDAFWRGEAELDHQPFGFESLARWRDAADVSDAGKMICADARLTRV